MINSQDLINSVAKNHTLSNCEADWRGICSRSYYTIYQDGKDFHQKLAIPGSLRPGGQPGIHQELIERLGNPGISKSNTKFLISKKIGALMLGLHFRRIKADYKRAEAITRQEADDSLAAANEIYEILNGGTADSQPSTFASVPTPPQTLISMPAVCSTPQPSKKPTLTRIK